MEIHLVHIGNDFETVRPEKAGKDLALPDLLPGGNGDRGEHTVRGGGDRGRRTEIGIRRENREEGITLLHSLTGSNHDLCNDAGGRDEEIIPLYHLAAAGFIVIGVVTVFKKVHGFAGIILTGEDLNLISPVPGGNDNTGSLFLIQLEIELFTDVEMAALLIVSCTGIGAGKPESVGRLHSQNGTVTGNRLVGTVPCGSKEIADGSVLRSGDDRGEHGKELLPGRDGIARLQIKRGEDTGAWRGEIIKGGCADRAACHAVGSEIRLGKGKGGNGGLKKNQNEEKATEFFHGESFPEEIIPHFSALPPC